MKSFIPGTGEKKPIFAGTNYGLGTMWNLFSVHVCIIESTGRTLWGRSCGFLSLFGEWGFRSSEKWSHTPNVTEFRHLSWTLTHGLSGLRSICPFAFAWPYRTCPFNPENWGHLCVFIISLPYGFCPIFLDPATVRKGGFIGCFFGSHVGRRVALILISTVRTIIITNIERCVPRAQCVPDTVARTQQTLSLLILTALLDGWDH